MSRFLNEGYRAMEAYTPGEQPQDMRYIKLNTNESPYTTYLFQKGLDKIRKKVGEESTEAIIAGKAEDKAETVYEIAELASRHIIDRKVKQEKMTK